MASIRHRMSSSEAALSALSAAMSASHPFKKNGAAAMSGGP